MIATGEVEHGKVGSHHRIPGEPLVAVERERRARRAKAAVALAEFSNRIGLED